MQIRKIWQSYYKNKMVQFFRLAVYISIHQVTIVIVIVIVHNLDI